MDLQIVKAPLTLIIMGGEITLNPNEHIALLSKWGYWDRAKRRWITRLKKNNQSDVSNVLGLDSYNLKSHSYPAEMSEHSEAVSSV